ncbi:hypothetical protein BJX99DRAFT_238757, partial [Aspergillus californicus]
MYTAGCCLTSARYKGLESRINFSSIFSLQLYFLSAQQPKMPLLSQSVSKSYSKPKPSIELISSHTELFAPNPPNPPSQPQSQPRSQPQPQDRIVLLAPLHNDTYITTHPATSFDFTTWLPLLAVGAPETWYAFGSVPDAQPILTSLDQPLLAPPKTALKPQTEQGH